MKLEEPWVGKIPWRRKWQSTPVLLPGESHGQRSLVGYSLWGRKKSDTTERLKSVSQSKEQDKCPPKQTKEEEIGNLPDKDSK